MIQGFSVAGNKLARVADVEQSVASLVWLDLMQPDLAETARLEGLLGLDIPTREEMQEIEISSRLYMDGSIAFMTATLPSNTETGHPEIEPVTFVLTPTLLITVRYHEPRAFRVFPVQAERTAMGCDSAEAVLLALLESAVDRLADILERTGREIDGYSKEVFRHCSGKPTKGRDFQKVLEGIGRTGDLTSDIGDSLVTLERLLSFFAHVTSQRKSSKDVRDRIKTLYRDVHSLSDHSRALYQKITFLLDATLGMIGIEQNAIIKIFSVAAVVFLPPTLIASIYGMNFEHMPELEWLLGYPFALVLMVCSAIVPYLFFKRRGWL